MNMILLEPSEVGQAIGRTDGRVRHILKVLRKRPGDEVVAGISDGKLGKALIESYDGRSMIFSFLPEREAPPLRPISIILGLPRPIQANRILKDLCSLGVRRLILCSTELGEKSYRDSGFYSAGEFRGALIEGAQQAANPRLPEVELHDSIASAVNALGPSRDGEAGRWALDPYRGAVQFGACRVRLAAAEDIVIAIGSERGWTPGELDLMEAAGFSIATLGDRILKSETAALSAAVIALSALGCI